MRITKMLIILGILITISLLAIIPMNNTIISEANIPSETEVIGLTLADTTDLDTLYKYLLICDDRMQKAHDMANQARNLGYSEDHIIIQIAQQEWQQANDLKYHYDVKIAEIEEQIRLAEAEKKKQEDAQWATKSQEYPVATQVWRLLKDYGCSDIVSAGILGNIMRECGGDTFNINPHASNGSHYGLCQWSKQYHSGAWGLGIEGQIQYLMSSADFTMFESCTTPEAAAEVFCWRYERPGKSDPAHKRLANARKAYNYFTN